MNIELRITVHEDFAEIYVVSPSQGAELGKDINLRGKTPEEAKEMILASLQELVRGRLDS